MPIDQDEKPSSLEKLGERLGISTRFENAHGRLVSVPPETIICLLDSLGVPVKNQTEAIEALGEYDQQVAERALPPTVVVVPHGDTCLVSVTATSRSLRILDWEVTLEDGGDLKGSFGLPEVWSSDEAIALPLEGLPFGYHRLRLPQLSVEAHLIVSPGKCWIPEDDGRGYWGIAIQLYIVRSSTNWGIGDFSDLRKIVEMSGERGCGFIGLNPLHQMFIDDPEAASPYSPATRLFLNPLYIDVEAVPEWKQSDAAQALTQTPEFADRLAKCRAAKLVDYSAVTMLKIEALQLVYKTFTEGALPERQAAFRAFCQRKGRNLELGSLFQVIRQQLSDADPQQADWRNWPEDLRNLGSEALSQFAQEHSAELQFHGWLQFIADEQLGHAAEAARRMGMAVGLYRDLAVGSAASGAETWANPAAFLERTLVGAPPDIFNPSGQNWGLPPFDPVALAKEGYRSFAELIRTNMEHSGGIRIDHVMGLRRLFCIPENMPPAQGAYVSFPLDDLLGILALESQRHKCLVVGEDLGTVPSGFRERLAEANILSYRVLFFEQDFDTGNFKPPAAYPKLAFANTGSHDLPTLKAWWTGEDIALKESLGLYEDDDETRSQEERRERERQTILSAFSEAGLFAASQSRNDLSPESFARHAHRFLGMTSSMLLSTQLDDMTGETAPVNVPGTSTEHPNWRRKYRLTLEELATDETAWALVTPLMRQDAHLSGS